MSIETDRLLLIACGPSELDQFAHEPEHLATRLDVSFPADFPVFPEGIAWWRARMKTEPDVIGWAIWFVIRKADRIVIGDGGFKGPPNDEGVVEIGYALVEAARGQGYGKEFARRLVDWAFGHPEVNAVTAETLSDGFASMAVLRSLGMAQTGSYVDPEEGDILQWRVDRAGYAARS